MAKITWDQIAGPNYSAGNNLLLQGRAGWDKALQQLSGTATGFATALENQNTNNLMDALHEAKDPTQFQSEDFQNSLKSLQAQYGQNYDRAKFRDAMDNRLGKLQTDALNAIQYTDAQQGVANRGATVNWLDAYARGDTKQMSEAASQMQGGLRPEMLTQGMGLLKDRHGMQMSEKEYKLSSQKAQWDRENQLAQLRLAQEEFDARYSDNPDEATGVTLTTEGDLASGYGPTIVPKEAAQYASLVSKTAKTHNIPDYLLYGVMHTESSFDPTAKSKAGAQGLMQIMPITQKHLGVTNPNDPAQSIDASGRYLAELKKRFGSTERALAAYNMGPGAYQEYLNGKRKMPAETREYVKKVTARAKQYRGQALGVSDSATLNDIVVRGKSAFNEQKSVLEQKNSALGMNVVSKAVDGISTPTEWLKKYDTIAGRGVYDEALRSAGFKGLSPKQQVNLLQSAFTNEPKENVHYHVPEWVPIRGGMRYTSKVPRAQWVRNYIEDEIKKSKTLRGDIEEVNRKAQTLDYHKALVEQSRKKMENSRG